MTTASTALPALTAIVAGAFPFAFALACLAALKLRSDRSPSGRDAPRPTGPSDDGGGAPVTIAPCARRTAAAEPGRRRPAQGGFTLVELLIAVAVAGILSTVAYPSFESQVLRARRADVLVAMMQVQLAEERWRSNHAAYGDLAQIGLAGATASGRYQLRIDGIAADGYRVLATATGVQTRDRACSHLALTVDGANVTQASGLDTAVANDDATNRRCWGL